MVIFFFSILTFEEVGWFRQNDARLFEKGKLVPGCHLKTKYLMVPPPLQQLPEPSEDPLLAISSAGSACAANCFNSPQHLL